MGLLLHRVSLLRAIIQHISLNYLEFCVLKLFKINKFSYLLKHFKRRSIYKNIKYYKNTKNLIYHGTISLLTPNCIRNLGYSNPSGISFFKALGHRPSGLYKFNIGTISWLTQESRLSLAN